jgi:hypothetical protein
MYNHIYEVHFIRYKAVLELLKEKLGNIAPSIGYTFVET